MRILGIDPGSRVTGWGVVDSDGWEIGHVECGAVRATPGVDLHERLHGLAEGVSAVIARLHPDVAAVEHVFTARNPRSALVLGQARGALLVTLAAAGLPLFEYTPAQVKSAVTGHGRADKEQVRQAIATQCGLREPPRPLDASDALAVALCHAGAARMVSHLERLGPAETAG